MPIYEYKCLNCGRPLEVMQKISDAPLQECPNCQGKLEKQWSLSGFQFKGTGWYVSDYGKQGAEAERKAENKTQNADESGSQSKSENKTEKGSDSNNSVNDTAKTSSGSESTPAKPTASKTESKVAENKPTAKID